jgi:alkyl sulfatase BDS1-like metallo-beta-lactamase superfamily hydrolase
VPIYAHASLLRNYLDETGLLAELQTARSAHMYGGGLGPADKDGANCGIGICIHGGTAGFIAPNRTFADRLEATVAGVRMQFLYVPSEADSEIAVYLPDRQVLLSAEVIQDHTFPNLYTIRGARYRDPVRWVHSIDLLRTLKAETMALQHGPPVLGHDEVQRVLTLYRDQIQYVHDQTVRAMNRGLSPAEIAETVRLPPHLDGEKPWGRQYYGTVSHSVRNIFGGYVGWFAGDPVELAPTPSVEAARRLVALVGGRERMLAEAERAYQAGDAQYAAELATPLVRIDQKDMQARHLKAAAFRRLGYAQMNANWRNYYLTAAMDLDDQIPEALYLKVAGRTLGSAMRSLPPAAQVELLPSRLIAEQTLNEDLVLGLHYRDAGEDFALHLRRGVLEVAPGPAAAPVFTIDATTEAMGALLAGAAPDEQINQDGLRLGGDEARARRFFTWLERPFTHKPEVVVR